MAAASERALRAAERSGDPRAVHEAAPLLASALLLGPTPLPEVLVRVAAVRDRLGQDRLAAAILRLTEASALALLDRVPDARGVLGQARATFLDLGQRRWLAAADQVEAELERQAGNLGRAIALCRDVHAFFLEQGDALNALPTEVVLADLLLADGRLEEADRLATRIEEQDSGDDLEVRVSWMCVGAVTASARGDRARADELIGDVLGIADATDFLSIQADARAILAAAAASDADRERLKSEAVDRYAAKGVVAPPELA